MKISLSLSARPFAFWLSFYYAQYGLEIGQNHAARTIHFFPFYLGIHYTTYTHTYILKSITWTDLKSVLCKLTSVAYKLVRKVIHSWESWKRMKSKFWSVVCLARAKEYTQNMFILAICLTLTLSSITLQKLSNKNLKLKMKWFGFFRSLLDLKCFSHW